MPISWLLLTLFGLAALGFWLGQTRALKSANGDRKALHSLPSYYGGTVVIWTILPSLTLLIAWLFIQSPVIEGFVVRSLQSETADGDHASSLMMADVRRMAAGLEIISGAKDLEQNIINYSDEGLKNFQDQLSANGIALGSDLTPEILTAAQTYLKLSDTSSFWMNLVVCVVSILGLAFGVFRSNKDFRARNVVERGIMMTLICAASIAILTTAGILLSLIFNTIEFFQLYRPIDFFFGFEWAPSFSGRGGNSLLGVIPLLWGTFYVSLIALLVAVPIGLFSAIYLSEYASKRVRAFAKPLLEVLAGIPTIVYGLFALLTVGPMLMRAFGDETIGLMSGGNAVITAGLVMGIMLIPFVSSLSDDIINAVPQALREGSYGLGATQSETIRQVILPAALPGIVGAILLAASRAIGETMIVVLGAGAAARLSLNPFDAMTTVTAKIVSQLTGDSDFSSPEVLVAFALGTTLFLLTLALNVLALYIVRRYREHYE
ncbi:MAG: phosphate ABC transporter permease subunit PstC [Aestuariivita sp.]|nr:phosphate ABC transporter permease subunit PstC [Aestuariivita sp.]MCY4347425.1 phosphate ABC transporter permease subunit PstC [Aestuariivita sp.]